MCCSVLQCVAVCCSVLQCVAVCCSVLQCVAVCCSVLQCVAVCCSVLMIHICQKKPTDFLDMRVEPTEKRQTYKCQKRHVKRDVSKETYQKDPMKETCSLLKHIVEPINVKRDLQKRPGKGTHQKKEIY